MSNRLQYTLASAAILAALPGLSQAATILSTESAVEVVQVGTNSGFMEVPTISGNSANATNGDVATSLDSSDFVSATQDQNGESTATAQTTRSFNTELSTATASFTQFAKNETDADRDFRLDYSLSGMSAQLFHNTDAGFLNFFGPPVFNNPFADDVTQLIDSNYTAASFQYQILVDGVEAFGARADVVENEDGAVLENVVGFMASLGDGAFGSTLFSVDDLSGFIILEGIAADRTVEVETILTARSYATNIFDEITNSVGVRTSDPVAISSTGFITSTPSTPTMTPVPLPAAGWMLLAGFGGLAAMKRRKKA